MPQQKYYSTPKKNTSGITTGKILDTDYREQQIAKYKEDRAKAANTPQDITTQLINQSGTGTSGIAALQERQQINARNAAAGFDVPEYLRVDQNRLSDMQNKQMSGIYQNQGFSQNAANKMAGMKSSTDLQKEALKAMTGNVSGEPNAMSSSPATSSNNVPTLPSTSQQNQFSGTKTQLSDVGQKKIDDINKQISELRAKNKSGAYDGQIASLQKLIPRITEQNQENTQEYSQYLNDLKRMPELQKAAEAQYASTQASTGPLTKNDKLAMADMPDNANLQFGGEFSQPNSQTVQQQDTEITGGQGTQTGQGAGTIVPGAPLPGGQGMSGAVGTIMSQVGNANDVMDMGVNLAQDTYAVQEDIRKNQLMRSLGGTDILQKAKAQGYNPYTMTVQELEAFVAANGINISEEERNRITAGGIAQIENLKAEKNDQMAMTEMARNQLTRDYERAIDEREDFNAQQDNRLKKMLASFGGGEVESLSGNMEVMRAREAGIKAKEDLLAKYSDKNTILSMEANRTLRTFTSNMNAIESQMANALDERYAQISQQVDDLISQGLTNKNDLNKAMYDAVKEYSTEYNRITTEAAKMMQEENKQLMDYQLKVQDYQLKADKQMSDMYGVVFQDGAPVVDQFGNTVPTMDNMEFAMEQDKYLTQQTGFIYQNGQLLLDQKGNPIQSFAREEFAFGQEKFYTQEERLRDQQDFNQKMDIAKFNESVRQFGLDYTLRKENFMMNKEDYERNRVGSLVEQGVLDKGALNQFLRPQDVISNAEYVGREGASNLGDRIANAIESLSPTDECVQFVRKVIPDLPTGLFNFADKARILLNSPGAIEAPEPGAVVVMDSGSWGHVAVVTAVDPINNTISLSESNWNGDNKYGTRTISLDDPSISGYWKSKNVQNTAGGDLGSPTSIAQAISTPLSGLSLSDIPQKDRAAVSIELNKIKKNALNRGDTQGFVAASVGGKGLSDSATQQIAQAQNVLGQLDNLESIVSNADTGPITGILRSNNPYDVQARQLQQQITALVPSLARGIFGEVGVLTDSDMRRYSSTIPNLNTPEGAKTVMMTAMRDIVNRSINTKLETYARAGFDVSGFSDMIQQGEQVVSSNVSNQDLSEDQLTKIIKGLDPNKSSY